MKRYVLIPLLLGMYALVMAYMGRERFFNPGTRTIYILTVAGEAIVLIALYFFLRRRDRFRKK